MDTNTQHRQDTNPYNSGGGGFDVEDRYAAWCMACWLSGVQPPGCVVPDHLPLKMLAWQRPKAEWLFDDLVLTFEQNGAQKRIGVSIKSGEYLKNGLPPQDLVEDLWRQVFGAGVRALADKDDLVIAAPSTAPEHAKDWRELGEWARVQTDDAFEANVTKANFGNDFKRKLLASFKCPAELAAGRNADQLGIARVLRRLQYVEHDFRIPTASRCVEEGIKRCSEALVDRSRTNAESLWEHLQRIAEQMRKNAGEITFERLLEHIRRQHRLIAHPHDAANWSRLEVETARRLDRISDSIGGLKLDREAAVQGIRTALDSAPLVALVAESGEGKTVCAKRLADALRAEEHRIVWLEVDQMCSADGAGRRLGLDCPLETLLRRVVENRPFLFVDQVDQFYDLGLQHLISLLEHVSAWRVVLTATPEGWRRVEGRIAKAVESRGSARLFHLPQLSRDEMQVVGGQHPHLWRILDDQRLCRIVQRPRVLDLIAQESITHAAASQWVSEADIIDWFFERVVERRAGDGRRSTVVRLAAQLADEFSASIPEDVADPADAERIAALHADRILRVQDGRIAFDHPLLADWSKRQYLIARENQIAEELKSNTRRDNPAWHRGLALFGLRLIEQRKDPQAFISLLNALESDDGPTSCGDSLLASVVTAIDPLALLDRLWPFLNTNSKLLQRILRVNHLVGTVPHPELQDERLRRPISWRYPLLVMWSHSRQADLIRMAPVEVAVIAETWLRTAGQRPEYLARAEAATLALALATAARADSEENRFGSDAERSAYRALLAAVPIVPDDAIELIRRCAERVADDPSARKHEWTARFDGIFEKDSKDLTPISPDAPLRTVDRAFREVARDLIAIEPLMVHSPEIAMEVILASLLQPVERHPYASFGFDVLDGAASSDPDWSPPMWWHGPFARLLRINESVGIDLILRLVNHVTEVWQYDAVRSTYRDPIPVPYMEIEVDGVIRHWPGGGARADNVFSWHSVGHRCPRSVQCALMALEQYLYQAENDGREVDAAISQVLNGSRSAAFAGLLAAVANHRPALLQGSLQLLLTCTEAVWHDELRARQREDKLCAGIGLPLKSKATQEQVSTWYCMGHRDSSLLSQLMKLVVQEDPLPLFERVRNRLAQRIVDGETGDKMCSLQLLAAWYDPSNWRVTDFPQGDIEFIRPPHLQPSDEDTEHLQRELDLLFLPMRARKLIDEKTPPDDEAMEKLWARLDEFATYNQANETKRRCVDAVAGIAAAAVILRPDWLKQEAGRYERALALIDDIAESPPPPSGFDSPDQLYDSGWDAFHADVAGTLYAREPEDPASRERVLIAITGVHYIAVGHLLRAFISAREPKTGVPLFPLLNFITEFAALREACNLDPALVKHAEEEFEEIAESFIQGSFEDQVQSWISTANRWTGVLCEGMMIQVIATAPRPSGNKAFFIDPAWAAVVEQGVEWLLHAASSVEAQEKDVADDNDIEHWPGRGVGRDLENPIVRLAAEAAVYSPTDSWSTGIVQKCLALPDRRHGARQGFAMWFASYAMGGVNDELPAEAVRRWSSLARVVLDLEESTSTLDDLSTAALGLSLMSEYSWPDKATPAATALAPHFERWIKSPRRDVEDAITFAYFLSRPAGLPSGLRGGKCPVGRCGLCDVLRRIAPEKEMAEETGLEPASPKAAVFKTAATVVQVYEAQAVTGLESGASPCASPLSPECVPSVADSDPLVVAMAGAIKALSEAQRAALKLALKGVL